MNACGSFSLYLYNLKFSQHVSGYESLLLQFAWNTINIYKIHFFQLQRIFKNYSCVVLLLRALWVNLLNTCSAQAQIEFSLPPV